MHRSPVDVREIAVFWADRLEGMLAALVRDRDAIAAERSVDITFDEFMADDLAATRRIYELAGSR